ncbi:ArsR/SmtB family transcription factor [Bacillus solimangrovi]|uniref:ArsR family transcriptional regulator n=1 Tax=Bacillus solimangrovi TaxID=1305675 RepID=A0A1E5LFF3_9BACI|nr:ArsR family transcriptional regulator [Bacillus solimangrovi]OEH92786.1 ArsR family transcriptional regulator [Bacillus solimangrovi]
MKRLYPPQSTETISLQVESLSVWEVILGIAGYTHAKLRHTFNLDEKWTLDKDSMPSSLVEQLKIIQDTNFWYGMIMLQNELSSPSIQDFSKRLAEMPIDYFYDTLLPYNNRDAETIRKMTATNHQQVELFEKYATYFESHDYLSGYIRHLACYSHHDICELFNDTLNSWYKWVTQHEEWEKWIQALTFDQKQYNTLDILNPTEEIERITGGIKYIPEPSIWTVKLIPHVSYRPWILELRTHDTKLFFYPLKDEYFLESGVPSSELIRGHKALGDELRLKIIYQLLKGPLSLQEMSIHFNTSKTSLHHQLSIIKAAKFISVDKGIYSANASQINDFSGKLSQYLEGLQ